MTEFFLLADRPQAVLDSAPYDRWISPEGEVKAEFHRSDGGFLVRFPDEADFAIEAETYAVRCWPATSALVDRAHDLFNNAIAPILGNHKGGLFLHGSAVAIEYGAIAFLGLSRRGKTTLAGAFAKGGEPFLTEDVIELVEDRGEYRVQPKEDVLRLFLDSAEFLLDELPEWEDEEDKRLIPAPTDMPFCQTAQPLRALFVLGDGEPDEPLITPLGLQHALAELLPHSFVLDVDDKTRLKAHFARLADLVHNLPCYTLDYRREYSALPEVKAHIRATVGENS